MPSKETKSLHLTAERSPFTWLTLLLPCVVVVPPLAKPPFFIDNRLAASELAYLLLALAVAGLALLRYARRPAPVALPKSHLSLLLTLVALVAWQVLTLAWTPNPGRGGRDLSLWLGLLIFLCAGAWSLDARAAAWLQYALAALAVTLSVSQTVKFARGEIYPDVFFSYGLTAEILATLLPLQLAACLCAERRWLALVSGLSAYLNLLALAETLRRGPIVGAALGVALVGLLLLTGRVKLQSWRRVAALALPLLLVAALYLTGALALPKSLTVAAQQPLGPTLSNLKQRARDMILLDLSAPDGDAASARPSRPETSSLGIRLRYWVVGWEMAKQHPWRGVGVGGYMARYMPTRRAYLENPRYLRLRQSDNSMDEWEAGSIAHNEYVQLLAELGGVGFALFLAFWAALVWRLWRRAAPNYLAFAVSSAVSSFSFRQAPSAVMACCLMILGTAEWLPRKKSAAPGDAPAAVTLPKPLVAAALCLTFALCALLAWRAYGSLLSQSYQAEPDLQFSPTNPANNEAWLRQYRRALDYDPYNFGAHFGCGLLLYQMKRPQEALPHLAAANRLGYARPFTKVLEAFACEQTGQLDEAVRLVEESLAAFPDSLLARTVYVEYLRKKGRIDEMHHQLDVLKQRKEALAKAVPLIMRMRPNLALEEARRQNLPPPYDFFPQKIARAILQMRTFHYLPGETTGADANPQPPAAVPQATAGVVPSPRVDSFSMKD
jgi:O-antigen ligase